SVELAPELVAALARKVEANRRHFPREATFADAFGVPGLYVRLDCLLIDARAGAPGQARHRDAPWSRVAVAICEFDDQPAFVGSFLAAGHVSAYRDFARLAAELEALGRPLRLAEFTLDPSYRTGDTYPHDDGRWLAPVHPNDQREQVSVIV